MKIVVCIKQVPDTKGGVKFNPDGTLDRGAMLAIMNPDDKAGLEAALRIKDETGAYLFIHCGGRRLAIGERIDEVAELLKKEAHGVPFIAAFTYGEYGVKDHGANTTGGLMLSFTGFSK